MTKKSKAPKKQKISNSSPALSQLPNEVLVSILARISKSYYSSLCLVSKRFYSLLSSPEIYTARTEIRATEPRLYLYSRSPNPNKNRLFTIGGELRLTPVRVLSSSYAAPTQLKSTSVSVGFEIYEIGGCNLSRAVSVLDCRSHTWRIAPRLAVARKSAKSCFLDGKIYVIGGREDDESMISGEVFDIKTQIWKPLPILVDDNSIDSNLQVLVLEGRVNVFTKKNKYVYDTEQERWLRDVLFVGFENVRNRHCCVIDDIMFAKIGDEYKWYNSRNGKWLAVENLDIVYRASKRFRYQTETVQLINHGGKLLITIIGDIDLFKMWCAVIRLEKRLTYLGTQIWGELEHCGYLLTAPMSYKSLSCLSISL